METKFIIPNYIIASKNTRALNFIVDIIFMKIIVALLYMSASFVIYNKEYDSLLNWLNSFDKAQKILLWSILMFLYYSIFEIVFYKTLSKYFTKTIVVMIDGSKPKPLDIIRRTLLRIIPFEYFTFLRGREPGWHDEYSGTFVVNENKLKESLSDFKESKNNSYVISN